MRKTNRSMSDPSVGSGTLVLNLASLVPSATVTTYCSNPVAVTLPGCGLPAAMPKLLIGKAPRTPDVTVQLAEPLLPVISTSDADVFAATGLTAIGLRTEVLAPCQVRK